ncbi:hypothetical protein D3C86_1764100 [compost metagenome]
MRVSLQEAAYDVRQQFMGQAHRAGHAQPPARFAGHAGNGLVGHFRLQQHGLAVAQVALTHRRQLQLARGALQQPGAEAFFQFGDTPRQARLGNAEHAPGGGETVGFDHLGEIVEVVEVLHGCSRLSCLWDKLVHLS